MQSKQLKTTANGTKPNSLERQKHDAMENDASMLWREMLQESTAGKI
jgi:hypothetical protein